MQERYWSMLTNKKYELIYINKYYAQCVKVQRGINIILALTSSGAIAAWAIWDKYPLLWSLIIAISQVVVAVKPLLPFEKRIIDINDLNLTLTGLYADIESKWFYIADGYYSEQEINDLYYGFDKKWTDMETKCFKYDSMPLINKLKNVANIEKENYFKNNFRLSQEGE